jgi:hypothetical protein
MSITTERSIKNVSLTEEHDDVRASRLRREEADAVASRQLSRIRLLAYLLALFGMAGFCVVLTLTASAAEMRDKAFTALIALVTGAFGYLAGEKTSTRSVSKI